MRLRHRRLACLVGVALLAACGDPKDAAGWAARAASRNRMDEKLAALEKARSAPGDKKAALAPLLEVLTQAPRARGEAAVILGEIGDPAALKPLVAALTPGDKPERDVNEANRSIASALGAILARSPGAPDRAVAVKALAGLLASKGGYTQVAAVDALGLSGDPAAVDALQTLVRDDQAEPFAVKKALLALGRLGDARAAPTVLRALFAERPGVTFFPEASFAASLLGEPMSAPLVAVVEGKDAELVKWATARGVHPAALRAKAAQLLGEVGGPGAVQALLGALAYTDADPKVTLFVRVFSAESLGRLRAREAVPAVAALLASERDLDARDRYAEALARIGDPAALPTLRAVAGSGPMEARVGPLEALTSLGGPADKPAVDAARKVCGAACPAVVRATLDGMSARLDAAGACAGKGVACWVGRLADPVAEVRDRAALEVGRAGDASQAPALADAIQRPVESDGELQARFHAVLGLDWMARRTPLGAKGAEFAGGIDKMVAADKGRTLTAGVDEDALRLASRLRRGVK